MTDHSDPVVEESLPEDIDKQKLIHMDLLEDGNHGYLEGYKCLRLFCFLSLSWARSPTN